MNIPDKATEALRAHIRETCVVDQMGEDGADWYADEILKLVTPIIAAQALRDESNRWDNDMAQNFEYRTYEIANEIEIAADKLGPQ